MTIVELAPSHAEAAAQLHIAGQPGTFLTSLGPEVLTVLYQALPQSPVGFGYVAVADSFIIAANSDLDSALRTSHSTLIQGFVSATTSVGRLFGEMGTRRVTQFLPPLVTRFVQQPSLLLRSVQTVLYPFLGHEQPASSGPGAELLSIMVAPTARSQGIGAQLMQALLAECAKRQLQWLDVTVDANNAGARRFYERHGFGLAKTFTLYGRVMCGYQLRLTKSSDSVRGVPTSSGGQHER